MIVTDILSYPSSIQIGFVKIFLCYLLGVSGLKKCDHTPGMLIFYKQFVKRALDCRLSVSDLHVSFVVCWLCVDLLFFYSCVCADTKVCKQDILLNVFVGSLIRVFLQTGPEKDHLMLVFTCMHYTHKTHGKHTLTIT